MDSVRRLIGFDSCLSVDQVGRSGDVAILWLNSVKCSMTSYSRHHLDLEVHDSRVGSWRLTGYYEYANRAHRRHSWDLIRHLSGLSQLPWCILGDFNDLLSLDAHLVDMDMVGYLFTRRFELCTPNAIEQRLDRVFATSVWLNLFP